MQAIFTFLDGYIHFATTDNRNKNDGVEYVTAEICVDCKQVSLGQTTGLILSLKYNKQYYNLLAINRSPSIDFDHFSNLTYIFVGDINIDIHSNVNSVNKDVLLNILCDAGFFLSSDAILLNEGDALRQIRYIAV